MGWQSFLCGALKLPGWENSEELNFFQCNNTSESITRCDYGNCFLSVTTTHCARETFRCWDLNLKVRWWRWVFCILNSNFLIVWKLLAHAFLALMVMRIETLYMLEISFYIVSCIMRLRVVVLCKFISKEKRWTNWRRKACKFIRMQFTFVWN